MKSILVIAGVVTIVAGVLWLSTGAHPYTKFEDVVREDIPVDEDDPFADSGFYDDDEMVTQVVTRDVFYFGLLPTPQGIFDKHAMSVASFVVPVWLIAGAVAIKRRRTSRQPQAISD